MQLIVRTIILIINKWPLTPKIMPKTNIQTIAWSNYLFLPREYPDMCNLFDGLAALGCVML